MTTSYLLTAKSLTVFHKGKLHTVSANIPHWEEINTALKAQDMDRVVELMDRTEQIREYAAPVGSTPAKLEVRDGGVYWQGEALHGVLVDRILEMQEEGFSIDPMLKFLERLQNNPSYRSRDQLYTFLEANDLPITDDGCFMAYKRVTEDYKDLHTRSFDNSVGSVVSMPRSQVDDDPSNTCSHGFHVAGHEYLKSFHGDRLIAVKVDPEDVVAVPYDYKNSKMRVAQYTVIQELPVELVYNRGDHWDAPVLREQPEEAPAPDVYYVILSTADDLFWGGASTGFVDDVDSAKWFTSKRKAEKYIARHYMEGVQVSLFRP